MSASNGVYAEFLLTRQSGSEKVPASRGVGFMHYPGYCARCQWIGGIFALYGLLQTCDRSVARGDAPASAATAPLQSSTCGSARCSDCTPARDHASPIPSEITQADSGRITRSCLNIDLYSDCVQGCSSSGVRDSTRTRSRGLAWAMSVARRGFALGPRRSLWVRSPSPVQSVSPTHGMWKRVRLTRGLHPKGIKAPWPPARAYRTAFPQARRRGLHRASCLTGLVIFRVSCT
jgi:hypothetical protein